MVQCAAGGVDEMQQVAGMVCSKGQGWCVAGAGMVCSMRGGDGV